MGQFLITGYWIELMMGHFCYLNLFFFFILFIVFFSSGMIHCNKLGHEFFILFV